MTLPDSAAAAEERDDEDDAPDYDRSTISLGTLRSFQCPPSNWLPLTAAGVPRHPRLECLGHISATGNNFMCKLPVYPDFSSIDKITLMVL